MEWRDTGIVLGVRRHGETAAVVELMTPAHGRHLGLVHGGRSRKRQPVLQPGNSVEAHWRGRLDEHLGTMSIEPLALRAGDLLASPVALHGMQAAAALLRLLPERDPHPRLARGLEVLVENLSEPSLAAALMVRFEVQLLDDLGFGLDLERCAATGERRDLTHVSPKTGRAVGREAAAPYAERRLRLPRFLVGDGATERGINLAPGDLPDLLDGFALTGHFLDRYRAEAGVGTQRDGAPDPRADFIEAVRRAMA